jgi:hypothetical protein
MVQRLTALTPNKQSTEKILDRDKHSSLSFNTTNDEEKNVLLRLLLEQR